MRKYSLSEYVQLVESSNTKGGLKALMARRKLKEATYESSSKDSYSKEFETLYLEDVRKCGYKTTIFIGMESDYIGTPGFQEWAEKLWWNECYSEFRFVRNFDWSFKSPERMIVFSNYNHKESQLAERRCALIIMQSRIEKSISKEFNVELFSSDRLRIELK